MAKKGSKAKGTVKTTQRKSRAFDGPKRRTAADSKQRSAPQLAFDGDGAPEVAFPIVAVGASAGGLEAFSQLLAPLPTETGFSIILVQHLAPKTASLLPELLAAQTKLPVRQVTNGMRIEPDHVYVIPPNADMTLADGALHLTRRASEIVRTHAPIDTFFSSVAEYAGSRAIGVILSGTATDGVQGIQAIKAAGGIILVQLPESARFDGMPRAAIATEMVDLILEPVGIAAELLRIARHPYLQRGQVRVETDHSEFRDEQLARVFQLLRAATGVDFTLYKPPTIHRRLKRRMVLHKIGAIDHYLKYLDDNPAEVQSLYQDILIHVTRFFREPDSFEELKRQVFPRIIDRRKSDNALRIWVPGCSTGEEPYSAAMALMEYLADERTSAPVQIFATDLSEAAIERARSGIYPASIAADVSPERLRRFFTHSNGNFQINKSVREVCVFARQDLTRDPPFSKLDLIVCRNVLIYLGTALQRKLMTVFHYALKPHGYLMLGHAESVGVHADLFAVSDKKHRLYSKKGTETPLAPLAMIYRSPQFEAGTRLDLGHASTAPVQSEVMRLLLDRYTPPGVVVDAALQIVQFHGLTGPFLEPAPGEASLNLLKMAREGLVHGLRTTLAEARRGDAPARSEGLRVKSIGEEIEVDLEVTPLGAQADGRHYLILFHRATKREAPPPVDKKKAPARKQADRQRDSEMARLEQELAANREYLQSIIQDMEAANEELQSANEEVLSSNEELQSTNEELDTAKEELQSTNEELNTLNEELHGRNEELGRVNSDLINLLGSVQIAILIVSGDMRIRRFTPMAEKVLNLIPSDVGRPIGHIKPNIDCPDLEQLITRVVDTMTIEDREVCDRSGRWYSLRIRPYKYIENRIDGAVLSLFDIHDAKKTEEQFAELEKYADAIFDIADQPLCVLDNNLRLKYLNRAYLDALKPGSYRRGESLNEFHGGVWNRPEVRAWLERVLAERGGPKHYQLVADFPDIGQRQVTIEARPISSAAEGSLLISFQVTPE